MHYIFNGDEIGEAYSMHDGDEKCVQIFLLEKERDHLEDLGEGGMIFKMDVREVGWQECGLTYFLFPNKDSAPWSWLFILYHPCITLTYR
jgi:hypothetical protein